MIAIHRSSRAPIAVKLDRTATYLSIDKDVLTAGAAHTNWDQGCMTEPEMLEAIALVRGRLIGADVTGDVSAHRYESLWKRCLSAIDRQTEVDAESLAAWRRDQHALNLRLLDALQG